MRYYFNLQAKLLFRSIKDYNENPYGVLVVLIPAFIFISNGFLKNISYASSLYLLIEVGLLVSLGGKRRNQFLASLFHNKKYILVRILENLIVAFPFACMLVITNHHWFAIAGIGLCLLLASFNNIGSGTTAVTIPSAFSKKPYEFSTGFRRSYLFFIAIYAIAFYSFFYHNLFLGLVCVLSVYIVCMTFYSHFEPIFYVWVHAQSASKFLKKKLTTAVFYSLLLSLPIVLLLIAFYSERTVQIIATFLLGVSYLVLSVLYVYVNFPVKTTSSQNAQYFIGLFIPPLLLLIIPNFYHQAVKRLKDYLLC